MTSTKFWDFWTPSLLSLSHSRNLSVLSSRFGQPPPSPQCGRHRRITSYSKAGPPSLPLSSPFCRDIVIPFHYFLGIHSLVLPPASCYVQTDTSGWRRSDIFGGFPQICCQDAELLVGKLLSKALVQSDMSVCSQSRPWTLAWSCCPGNVIESHTSSHASPKILLHS